MLPMMMQMSRFDLILQQQANAIAQAYLEEILSHPYSDPDQVELGSVESGETRATFDDVQDYNSLPDTIVRDYSGAVIAALSDYAVTVKVTHDVLGVNAAPALRIDVHVAYNSNQTIYVLLSGYKCEL